MLAYTKAVTQHTKVGKLGDGAVLDIFRGSMEPKLMHK